MPCLAGTPLSLQGDPATNPAGNVLVGLTFNKTTGANRAVPASVAAAAAAAAVAAEAVAGDGPAGALGGAGAPAHPRLPVGANDFACYKVGKLPLHAWPPLMIPACQALL